MQFSKKMQFIILFWINLVVTKKQKFLENVERNPTLFCRLQLYGGTGLLTSVSYAFLLFYLPIIFQYALHSYFFLLKKLPCLDQCFFFYVKKRLPSVKKNGFPYVKIRTCTWKNLQKCPWKINSLREIFFKFTYVKI